MYMYKRDNEQEHDIYFWTTFNPTSVYCIRLQEIQRKSSMYHDCATCSNVTKKGKIILKIL